MRQYEKNLGKLMPIRQFGQIKGKEVVNCILRDICDADGMIYFLDFYSADGEKLGSRWITRYMYRYHVMNKAY